MSSVESNQVTNENNESHQVVTLILSPAFSAQFRARRRPPSESIWKGNFACSDNNHGSGDAPPATS